MNDGIWWLHMEATVLVWAVIGHLIADWLLQNQWMALNKVSLRHPAAWVHGGIHFAAMMLAFPVVWAPLVIALAHVLIDTRRPFRWWARVYGQATEGPYATHVAVWVDQVMHVATIAAVVLLLRRF